MNEGGKFIEKLWNSGAPEKKRYLLIVILNPHSISVNFRNSLRLPIYKINSGNKPKYLVR